jgi:hypothetical protein
VAVYYHSAELVAWTKSRARVGYVAAAVDKGWPSCRNEPGVALKTREAEVVIGTGDSKFFGPYMRHVVGYER